MNIYIKKFIDSFGYETIEEFKKLKEEFNNTIDEYLNKPISVTDDDFKNDFHKQSNNIYINGDKIMNDAAYKIVIRKTFDLRTNSEVIIENQPICVAGPHKINIFRGGVVGKSFFDKCSIRPDKIINGQFNLPEVFYIPVHKIIINDKLYVYAMDWREPEYHKMIKYYDCTLKRGGDIAGVFDFIDLRQFKKL